MFTSLQNLVSVGELHLRQQDIQQLFIRKAYPRFQLQEFYKHGLHESHQQFRFFVDVLEEWNRKIENQESHNYFNTILHKNVFIYNSLRNAIMKPPEQAHQLLLLLYRWFKNTPNRTIKPVETKRKQSTEQDEDWLIRNTFKSNLPAEIDMYHRRIVCKEKQQETKNKEEGCNKPAQQSTIGRKVKTECWSKQQSEKELERKRVAHLQNEQIRFQRQQEELEYVQIQWKMKKARKQKENMKDYYRATFSTGKNYFDKRRKTVKENSKSFRAASFTRLKTASRDKIATKEQAQNLGFTDGNAESTAFRKSQNEAEQFNEFSAPAKVRLSQITGLRLITNPFQAKLKKKKRAK